MISIFDKFNKKEYFNSFLLNLSNMEIIYYSPNLFIHLHDAVVVVQLLIDGFIEIAGKFKV